MKKNDELKMSASARARFQKNYWLNAPQMGGPPTKSRNRSLLDHYATLVENGETPPDRLARFVAEGIRRLLDGGVPWPTYSKASCSHQVTAMIQVIYERFGMIDGHRNTKLRGDIASHLDCTPRTVGNYLKCKQQGRRETVLCAREYRVLYPAKDTADRRKAELVEMLNALTELASKPKMR